MAGSYKELGVSVMWYLFLLIYHFCLCVFVGLPLVSSLYLSVWTLLSFLMSVLLFCCSNSSLYFNIIVLHYHLVLNKQVVVGLFTPTVWLLDICSGNVQVAGLNPPYCRGVAGWDTARLEKRNNRDSNALNQTKGDIYRIKSKHRERRSKTTLEKIVYLFSSSGELCDDSLL